MEFIKINFPSAPFRGLGQKYPNWDILKKNLELTPFIFKTINCTVGEHNYFRLSEIAEFAVNNKVLSINFTTENIHVNKDPPE